MKTYVCLMIDIKASKSYSIEQRNIIQKYMLDVMHCLNHLFQHQLVHEVVCSAGDEMQGVFYHAKDAWMYFRLRRNRTRGMDNSHGRSRFYLSRWTFVLCGTNGNSKSPCF